jgi:hypothetical protein
LACSATLASVERCFLAAAVICGHNWGSFSARAIGRCVSLHQCLQQGFKANGGFEVAQLIFSQAGQDAKHN